MCVVGNVGCDEKKNRCEMEFKHRKRGKIKRKETVSSRQTRKTNVGIHNKNNVSCSDFAFSVDAT